ncbi:MAG: Crp/Fnr family transcriptional regulator [Acetobacter sp.]|uniref:Crp/Fnr family transcriptional regulator n=1 Tax=Acetobacter sp. TaxID=440 RepID=UPI0039EC9B6B
MPRRLQSGRPYRAMALYEAIPDLQGEPYILEALKESERNLLFQAGKQVTFKLGDTLFRQGDPHGGIFIIRSGSVRTYYAGPNGREITLAMWPPGNFVGGPEIFSGGRHIWSGEALEPVEALYLSAQAAREMTLQCPAFALALVHALAHKGRCYSALLQMLATRSAIERLAQVLLNLAELSADGRVLPDHLSHEELGMLIGSTRQWVTASMSRFLKKGVLGREGKQMIILAPAVLKRLGMGIESNL